MTTVAAALLVFASIYVYGQSRNAWKITADTVIYQKNQELKAVNVDTKEERVISTEMVEELDTYEEDYDVRVLYNDEENSRLIYASQIRKSPLENYTLYEQNTKNWKEKPKQIATKVRLCTMDDENNIYYVTYDSGKVYKYNGYKTQSIHLPYVSELKYVKDAKKLFVLCKVDLSYKVNEDGRYSRSLDDCWKNEKTQNAFYHIHLDTFSEKCIEKDLGEQVEITSDYKRLYYLKRNQLYECSMDEEKPELFRENVCSFCVSEIENQSILYYIDYMYDRKSLYSFVKDPYAKEDLDREKKRNAKEEGNRKKRETLRQKLRDGEQLIMKGTLHSFDGTKDTVFEGQANSLVKVSNYEKPYVYKACHLYMEKEFPEDGEESFESYYIDCLYDEEATYDACVIQRVNLYNYKDSTSAIPSEDNIITISERAIYKPENMKLVKQEVDLDESNAYLSLFNDSAREREKNLKESVKEKDGRIFSVELNGTYQLVVTEKGKKTKLLENVSAYRMLSDGRVVAVGMKGQADSNQLYLIQTNNEIECIDTDVEALLGEGLWTLLGNNG